MFLDRFRNILQEHLDVVKLSGPWRPRSNHLPDKR